MITNVQIDHREWRDWRNPDTDGAIGRLNLLLSPHDVQLKVISEPADWIDIQAVSMNADIREQLRVITAAFNQVEAQRDSLVLTVGELRRTLARARAAFVALHEKWLSAGHRRDMNDAMDQLESILGSAWSKQYRKRGK